MKGDDENMVKRRSHRTIVVYLSILAAIVLATVWVSRFVLFQPWTAREWVSATAAAGNIYAFGGKDREGQNYDEIYRIDLQDVRIHEVAELPTPRFGMGVAALTHSVYLLGGFDGRRCYDEILVFDTRTNKIKKLASLPAPRAFGSVATIGRRIFYLGGWNGSKLRPSAWGTTFASVNWRYHSNHCQYGNCRQNYKEPNSFHWSSTSP